MTLRRFGVRLGDFLVVRNWRFVSAEPSVGCWMWFDPSREEPLLRRATPTDSDRVTAGGTLSLLHEMEPTPEVGVVPSEGSDSEEILEGEQKVKWSHICDLPF